MGAMSQSTQQPSLSRPLIHDRISIDPDICHGKPVIRGTRVIVKNLLLAMAGGDTVEMLVEDYKISKEDVEAVIRYGADQISPFQIVGG